ncbi:MAG: FAD-dependent oxidoreductase [Candidatus Heimdallarchaeota archaeon]|nr:FAD-dependent oxidoreductase [Candidatus Heimdallarchaeota archaeon]
MKKLAIIGSGVGGAAVAYHLKDTDLDITVFEKREVAGGRVRFVEFEGIKVEVGAGFFHSINKHIMRLTDELNVEKEILSSDTFGLWDGEKMRFQTGHSSFINNLKFLFRFGFGVFKLQSAIKLTKSKVRQFQDEDKIFQTMEEMIDNMSFSGLYSKQFVDGLRQEGINDKIIDELAIPATRYIYHQCGRRSMNGFAGFVSLVASDGEPIYYIKNGNRTLAEQMIERSQAKLRLSTAVTKIAPSDGKFILTTENGEEIFDIVVIFTPLEIANIKLENIDFTPFKRDFVPYTKTILTGEINPQYFGVSSAPDMIMTTDGSNAPMKGMNKKRSLISGTPVWTLSSSKPIAEDELHKMFNKIHKKMEVTVPYTYPELEPVEQFDKIILEDNLYYGNSIDTLSPTMESSIIMGRNIARLIKQSE